MSAVAEMTDRISDAQQIAADLVRHARIAQADFADADQARVDEAVRAVAWSLYKPEHARELAELAVKDTGLGNVAGQDHQEAAQDLRHAARSSARQIGR